MTFKFKYAGLILMIAVLFVGCKHKKKQSQNQQAKQKQQQMIQQQKADSLRRVRQRRDSLRKARTARADSIANAKKKQKMQSSISLKKQGAYTIQVAAWRSIAKAKKRAKIWKKRGFDHAYTVKYHGPEPGDVWFRVRLGYTNSRAKAQKVQQRIQQKYHVKSWISGSS